MEFILFLIFIVVYFLPSIIANSRKCKSETWIVLINLFFGWTGLGWIGLFIWSIAGEKKDKRDDT